MNQAKKDDEETKSIYAYEGESESWKRTHKTSWKTEKAKGNKGQNETSSFKITNSKPEPKNATRGSTEHRQHWIQIVAIVPNENLSINADYGDSNNKESPYCDNPSYFHDIESANFPHNVPIRNEATDLEPGRVNDLCLVGLRQTSWLQAVTKRCQNKKRMKNMQKSVKAA